MAASPLAWRLLAALLLLVPLVQGGTPRLPALVAELAILAAVVAWLVAWARSPSREERLGAPDAWAALLLFWALFSTIFAPYYHAAQAAVLAIASYAGFFWCLSFNPSFAGLELALRAVRLQAAAQALLALWQGLGAGVQRPAGTFYNPNFLAGFLAVALLVVLARLLYPRERPSARVLYPRRREVPRWPALALEAALLLAGLFVTGSRGGVLALAAGLAVLLAVRSWKLSLAAFAGAAVLLVAVPNPLLTRLQSLRSVDPFAWSRLRIWQEALQMMRDHPLVGVGLGQFEYLSPRYAFALEGHWAKHTRVAENAHSEYLQAGAELGVPGLLLGLGAVALLACAAAGRLRALPRAERGPVAALAAGAASIAAQAAVDFPLHTPPGALLLVLCAAGLRVHGASCGLRPVSFRVRPLYAGVVAALALAAAVAAVRPVVGFRHFLAGIGAPQQLLREKWALEEAPRATLPPLESARLLELAARWDPTNASYHRAAGSRLFQAWLRGEAPDEARARALYHLSFALELNPNQYQYELNLGQALTALARREPPATGRERLREAVEHYRRAAEIAPWSIQVQTELGLAAEEAGDLGAAEAALRRAVAIEEYHLRGWFTLGTFLARRERWDEAREAFARGAELAVKAKSLVPTSEGERELIAVEPDVFYNEIRKIERATGAGEGSAS